MDKIGVIASSPIELKSLTTKKVLPGQPLALDKKNWCIAAGIGGKKAHHAAQQLIDKGVNGLVSWGTAGGLDPSLSPGTLVLPKVVVSEQNETINSEGPWYEQVLNRLHPLTQVATGSLLQSYQVITSRHHKQDLFKKFDAQAVDMESFSVAQAAQAAQLPFLCIRAIIDNAYADIPKPALSAMDRQGQVQIGALLGALLCNPLSLGSTLRLAKCFGAAQKALKQASHLLLN